jgi:hypothetical protein
MGMNKGLEKFRPFPPTAMDIDKLPIGVDVQSKSFDRDTIHISSETGQSTAQPGRQYWLLNSLGSSQLPDGNYLYNPQTKQIEIQWIQGIGGADAPAPQAKLMSIVISGILNHRLPWGLVLLGVFMVIGVELLGIRSLSFAVGFYISIGTTLIMFCGGMVRWLVEWSMARSGEAVEDSEVSPGSLYASGLIAAGGIVGLLGIAWKLVETKLVDMGKMTKPDNLHPDPLHFGLSSEYLANHPEMQRAATTLAVIAFLGLAYSLYHFARKPLEENKK